VSDLQPRNPNGSVIQEWVIENCSWKEQTVLFTALRGYDSAKKDPGKPLVRILRSTILKSADSSTGFMTFKQPHHVKLAVLSHAIHEDDLNEFLHWVGFYSTHWLMHLAHAIEIIGYRHPEINVRTYFYNIYNAICEALHVNPESEPEMTERLKDRLDRI
jgi:hypothetical protein